MVSASLVSEGDTLRGIGGGGGDISTANSEACRHGERLYRDIDFTHTAMSNPEAVIKTIIIYAGDCHGL
jgi:hypothetical protein